MVLYSKATPLVKPVQDRAAILRKPYPHESQRSRVRRSMSARACQGILTRASKRGKKLPDLLQTALLEMIEWWENGASASVGTQSIEQQNKTGWV